MRTITSPINVLSYSEFDELIHETFPQHQTFECIAEFEWNNDSEYLYEDVQALDQDSHEQFDDWLNKAEFSYADPSLLLSALITAGKLEPGNYLIEICW